MYEIAYSRYTQGMIHDLISAGMPRLREFTQTIRFELVHRHIHNMIAFPKKILDSLDVSSLWVKLLTGEIKLYKDSDLSEKISFNNYKWIDKNSLQLKIDSDTSARIEINRIICILAVIKLFKKKFPEFERINLPQLSIRDFIQNANLNHLSVNVKCGHGSLYIKINSIEFWLRPSQQNPWNWKAYGNDLKHGKDCNFKAREGFSMKASQNSVKIYMKTMQLKWIAGANVNRKLAIKLVDQVVEELARILCFK